MRYITGTYALNVNLGQETPGDWHASALDWEHVPYHESDLSPFGDWRIMVDRHVPHMGKIVNVADHIRACLDLIEAGKFGSAQGMRRDFIDDKRFTREIFDAVWKLHERDGWPDIDSFMGSEYLCDWLDYKEERSSDEH